MAEVDSATNNGYGRGDRLRARIGLGTATPRCRATDVLSMGKHSVFATCNRGPGGSRRCRSFWRREFSPGSGSAFDISRRSNEELASDRKSTRLNSSHGYISYAVFCLKKKKKKHPRPI